MRASRREFLAASGVVVGGLAGGCRARDVVGRRGRAAPLGVLPPVGTTIDLAGHVLNRCTFGPRPGDREGLLRLASTPAGAIDAWMEAQLRPETIDDADVEGAIRRLSSLDEPAGELYEYKKPVLLHDLVTATLLRAIHSRRQLHAVMVEFWTDHFNIDMSKGDCAWLKAADDRDVVRRHALGRFPELLRASALSPAMLWYLDGRANRRASPSERPNENYARELLELHTLGVHGGYTQHDVMELARCLTGFTVRPRSGLRKGAVEFRREWHDDGPKEVLGFRIPGGQGEQDLDSVLDVVATHPSTARHIAIKLCRRFIAEVPTAAAVEAVATAFSRTAGDLSATLRALFATPEFQSESVRGSRLKRPFHYVVSALRALGAETDAGAALRDALTAMGQAPFAYPTPDGYPIASDAWRGTLLARWRFAAALTSNELSGTHIDLPRLHERVGTDASLMAHLLCRAPNEVEKRAWASASGLGERVALLLASPAFQRF